MLQRAFQPTRPVRGVTLILLLVLVRKLVSTHTPRAGRDFRYFDEPAISQVSTHTPRAGRDYDYEE